MIWLTGRQVDWLQADHVQSPGHMQSPWQLQLKALTPTASADVAT
jgi:hypothetical protein